jgi:hypothetical protein
VMKHHCRPWNIPDTQEEEVEHWLLRKQKESGVDHR